MQELLGTWVFGLERDRVLATAEQPDDDTCTTGPSMPPDRECVATRLAPHPLAATVNTAATRAPARYTEARSTLTRERWKSTTMRERTASDRIGVVSLRDNRQTVRAGLTQELRHVEAEAVENVGCKRMLTRRQP
jgi:hypothetical protein